MSDRALLLGIVSDVNGTGAIAGYTARLNDLAATAPAASVQSLPGARWLDRYVDGGGTRELPFAVLLRTRGTDTAGRADGFGALSDLADALEALGAGYEGRDTPALVERADNGTEVWRATFALESEVSASGAS